MPIMVPIGDPNPTGIFKTPSPPKNFQMIQETVRGVR